MSRSRAATGAPFYSGTDGKAYARGRALHFALVAALVLSAFVAASHEARAQIGGSGGPHSIYGDFKVDESKAGGMVPISFVLVLMTDTGKIVERQSAMNGTRYRFLGLREGNYDIIVESAGIQVVTIRVPLFSQRALEFKQDLLLEWDRLPTGKSGSKKGGTVSAADSYERTPANRALFEKASGAMNKKKFDEAAALLQKIVEADPKDHLAWTDLGTMQYALGNNAEAERSYARALSVRPDLLTAAVNLGRLRIATKNFEGAVEVLKPVVEKHPQSADANQLLGEAYLQTGKNDEAITYFNEAIRLDPQGKADAHLRLAMIHDAAGHKDKAADELEQFLAKRPDYPERKKFEQYVKENKRRWSSNSSRLVGQETDGLADHETASPEDACIEARVAGVLFLQDATEPAAEERPGDGLARCRVTADFDERLFAEREFRAGPKQRPVEARHRDVLSG